MNEIRIRHARLEDAGIITEFNARMAIETEDLELDRAVLLRGVRRALADEGICLYFVAEVGDRVIGQCMITYEFSDWRDGWIWWFQSVYVHPDHRRRGVFRALFDHSKREAADRGDVRALRLYVEEENHAGKSTYTRLGMSYAGYEVWHVDIKNAEDM